MSKMEKFENKDIFDDEIRIVGNVEKRATKSEGKPFYKSISFIIAIVLLLLVVVISAIYLIYNNNKKMLMEEPAYFEPVIEEMVTPDTILSRISLIEDEITDSFCEVRDTVINDVPLRLFIPHNAYMTLHIGKINKKDTTIIFTAQAADIRADNGGIVGAFVEKGVPRAWGLSKKGFCASIDSVVTVGVADNSPLFEKATEQGGYFFRQYPLVDNGQLVENNIKGKSVRRAICDRRGEIFMVESGMTESFHDFAQSLVDMQVDNAIYLVGSSAYGWAVDREGTVHEFGEDNYYTGRRRMPKNTSYIVWRMINK